MTAVTVLGVPSSAGSHNAGQERAPAALRAAGLVERLRAGGLDLEDAGDLPVRVHAPAPVVDGVRNLEPVLEVVRDTAAAVGRIVGEGRVPLVLGGDCTITLGVTAGTGPDAGLVYVDGDADLNTPDTGDSYVLDTMGITHLLGDGVPELAAAGGRLDPSRLALVGFDPGELDQAQWTALVRRGLTAYPAPAVRADPAAAARAALEHLRRTVDRHVVHLDVDVLDTGAFPLANFPHFHGLTLAEVSTVLDVLLPAPGLAALVVTEVNPTHDPTGGLVERLVSVLVDALTRTPDLRA